MLDNHAYNLMNQLVVEHKSLWRIKKMYKRDAERHDDCLAFWDKMEKDKENHIGKLKELIKNHLK